MFNTTNKYEGFVLNLTFDTGNLKIILVKLALNTIITAGTAYLITKKCSKSTCNENADKDDADFKNECENEL